MIEKTEQRTLNMATTRQSSFKPALLALAITQTLLLAAPADALAADTANSEIEVTGRSDTGTGTSYTANASNASTGMTMSLRETPQSVSVITRQRMQDQGLETLDDVLLNTTGITVNQLDNSSRLTYRSRGFDITNFKTDGLQTHYNNGGDGHANAINLDLYDRVDVIRGANGLTGSTGDPSATINLIRKAPQKQAAASVGLIYGSYDKRRAYADVNAPLAFDGRVRSRFVISGEDSGSWRDRSGTKNLSALASFSADLTESTLLNIGAQYDYNRIKGASWGANVPVWYADGSLTDLPRSFNPVPDWAHTETNSKTFFGSVEQYFAQDWKTKVSYSHNEANIIYDRAVFKANSDNRDNRSGSYAGFFTRDGDGGRLNAEYSDYVTKEDDFNWTVNGIFHLFGRSHELMGGFDYYRIASTAYAFDQEKFNNCGIGNFAVFSKCQYRATPDGIPVPAGYNVFNWDGTGIPDFNVFRTNARKVTTSTNYGGYLAGRFNIIDPLNVIIGVRLSNYKVRTVNYDQNNNIAMTKAKKAKGNKPAFPARPDINTYNSNGVVTPYAGITYNITDNHTAYISYTSIFSPQSYEDEEGHTLKPVLGNSYEGGVKSEFFGGRLNTSAVLFWEQQKNKPEKSGGYTPAGDDAYSSTADNVNSRGVELELSGMLTDNWNAYLGYTYLNVNNPGAKRSKITGQVSLDDPHHVLRLFTTYQLPGALNGLTIGGGARIQSYTLSVPNPIKRPPAPATKDDSPLKLKGFALVDLMARYRFNKNVALTVNVDNLFDNKYYRQRGFYAGQIYGDPRTYWATLNVTY